jgi:heme exporter protein D
MSFQFESVASFIAMNGHGSFVWAAYGITFAVLAYLLISPLLQQRQFFRTQKRLMRIARK